MAYNIPLSSSQVKELLHSQGARANRRLGQHFLVDPAVLAKIVSSANLQSTDMVLEIGPGLGILTQALAKKAKRVIAIEKDQKIAEILRETSKNLKNIKIIEGDILTHKIQDTCLAGRQAKYKVVANLPYYITSPVIRKFLEKTRQPELMVLMVQKEVAQRICAKPPHMSLLALSVQFYAKSRIISYVPKTSFWPQPKVDSAILTITPFEPKSSDRSFLVQNFFRIARAGFKQPRKQLLNNLSRGLGLQRQTIRTWLMANNLNPSQRAETLSREDWVKLAQTFQKG